MAYVLTNGSYEDGGFYSFNPNGNPIQEYSDEQRKINEDLHHEDFTIVRYGNKGGNELTGFSLTGDRNY